MGVLAREIKCWDAIRTVKDDSGASHTKWGETYFCTSPRTTHTIPGAVCYAAVYVSVVLRPRVGEGKFCCAEACFILGKFP